MQRYILTLCTLAIVSAGAAPALAADALASDPRQLVRLPEPMQQHMLGNMRDHLVALDDILAQLAAGQFERAADIAERRIGMSSLEAHGAAHMAPYMPKAMQDTGTAMHRAASRFALVAQEGELPRAVHAMREITRACIACHNAYRLR